MKILILLIVVVPFVVRAHLCDNVFAQAKDNLVVKVDVRDGQLRIGRESSFRVYLLNTMDRDIADIALDVGSAEFEAEVVPSPEWSGYPALWTTKSTQAWRAPGRKQGKKEYFTVNLRRKPGVPDGAYKIDLNLVSRRNRMSFRSVDLSSAADICPVPRVVGVVVDGRTSREEWGDAFLCANFQSYQKSGRFMENVPASEQTRVRLVHDSAYLYFMASFHGGENAEEDALSIYLAPGSDDSPKVLTVNRKTGILTGPDGPVDGVKAVAGQDGVVVEGRIPLASLGLKGLDSFYMNFTRTIVSGGRENVSYWRGNELSLMQPVAYGQFVFTK